MCRLSSVICFLLIIISSHSLSAWRDRGFARAQCIAVCLRKFALEVHDNVESNDTRLISLRRSLEKRPDLILMHCTKKGSPVPSCNSCVKKGCQANARTAHCESLCKDDEGCLLGCKTLLRVSHSRPGSCPPPRLPSKNNRGSCFRACSSDIDCRLPLLKCCPCSTGGSRCVTAVYNSSIPNVDLRKFMPPGERKIELKWRSEGKTNSPTAYLNPIVYLVQIRDYIGRIFNEGFTRSWHNVVTATVTAADINEVRVGTWYQFRIAAVTADGTGGFKTVTSPISLGITPRPPTAPRNVSDGVWRIHAGGIVNVEINWAPPEFSDFSIYRYQVVWVKDHGYVQADGKSVESFTRFEGFTPGDATTYTIGNLMPATSYKVQVTAHSRWGMKVLTSPPNTLFITTPHVTSPKDENYEKDRKAASVDGRCVCDEKTPGLFIYKPIFNNGSLDVKILLTKTTIEDEDKPYLIEWSPKVCIATSDDSRGQQIAGRRKSTMESRVKVIKDLAFNCRYWLRLAPLEAPGREDVITTCFCTPTCRDVNVPKHGKKPECSPDTSLPVPASPTNILARKVGRQEFALTWKRPKRANLFNRFRVVWGPREDEPVNKDMYGDSGLSPKINFDLAETKVVANNVTSLRLKNLRDATMYIVKIQALTFRDGKESESPESVLYFTTDGFTNPPTVADYRTVVRQYVRKSRGNGNSPLSPSIKLSLTLLCFFLLVRDFT